VSVVPALVRLAVGTAVLAARKLRQLTAEWTGMAEAELHQIEQEQRAPAEEEAPESFRHVVIGLTAAAPALIEGVMDALRPLCRSTVKPVWERLGENPALRRLEPVLEAMERECRELATSGLEEEARSTGMAQAAITDIVKWVSDIFGESPELENSIGERSTGLAGEAGGEIRNQARRPSTKSLG
jgi:uncharacterized membrane protein YccC